MITSCLSKWSMIILLDHDWLFFTHHHHHNDSQKALNTLLNLLCYSFNITNGAPNWAKKNLLSPSGSPSCLWFFKAFLSSLSSQAKEIPPNLGRRVHRWDQLCALSFEAYYIASCRLWMLYPRLLLSSVSHCLLCPRYLSLRCSSVSSPTFLFGNGSPREHSSLLSVSLFFQAWWLHFDGTSYDGWSRSGFGGLLPECLSKTSVFKNKQDRQMAYYTDRCSSFLPVVNTILASFTPASTNCEFEVSGR